MTVTVNEVQLAVDRAHRVLWKSQRPDGSWDCPADIGAWVTAQVVVVLRWLGRLNPDDTQGAAKWLAGQQRPDGSFTVHRYAKEGDLGATACGWAALHLCGATDAAGKAQRWVEARGGTRAVIDLMNVQDFSALFVAMAGLVDAKRLPCPSTTALLLPPVLSFVETRFHAGVLMGAWQTEFLIRRLRGDFGPDGRRKGLIDHFKCRAALELFGTFFNTEGSWNGGTAITALALPMMQTIGDADALAMLERAVAWLELQKRRDATGVHFAGYGTDVWSTAFDARALFEGGIRASDPDLARALKWMAEAQLLTRPQPRVDNRKPNAVRLGGWGFQKANETMPDNDDAGVILSALAFALDDADLPAEQRPQLARAAELGTRWLFDMQNPDGGWSAFVWGLPGKPPGPIMQAPVRIDLSSLLSMAGAIIDPPPVTGDPSTEDVTARVLHAMGHLGQTVTSSPAIQNAVAFLQKQQASNGGWWGRWVVNYLSATAFVLMGLKAVGVDLKQGWVQRGVKFLLSKQNADGGWGEGPASYRSEGQAGVGPTMLPLTGLVLQALVDAGEGDSDAVKRGVRLLLDAQRADGTWANGEYLHVNIPPDTFYVYEEAARFYPASALGKYLAHLEHRSTAGDERERWSNAKLDAFRHVIDPVADGVIAKLFARGQVDAVNSLMFSLFRSDEPLPPGLPPEAAEYFETVTLPPWADKAQIALAQQLFTRAGWEIAMGLFCSSLPQAYAAANGAHVIVQTQGMTKHVRQRIFETAQFLFDVLDEGALEPSGRGLRTAQKVRLMHATVRHFLLRREDPKWDTAVLGLPINQEDEAGTLMTFSVVTLDALRLTGVPYSPEEANAWLHLWKVIGHVLGIHDELLPTDLIDAQELMEAIRDRQWRPSEDGRVLTNALVGMMQAYFPAPLDGLPIALIRALTGEHCGDLLGLPKSDWTRTLVDTATLVDRFIPRADPRDPLARMLAWASHELMVGLVTVQREGKQARFRIPKALTKTIDPSQ